MKNPLFETLFIASRSGKFLFILAMALIVAAAGCGTVSKKKRMNQINAHAVKLAKKGYWEESAYWWDRMLQVDPDNYKALNNMAIIMEKKGNYESAKIFYDKALSIDPGNRTLKKNLKNLQILLEAKEKKPADADEFEE